MQFNGGTKRRNRAQVNNKSYDGSYSQRLQMYKLPPTKTISLYEFEDFAVERLKGIDLTSSLGRAVFA